MKLTTFILITVILQVSASSFAQKITLSEKNASLISVLEKIRMQSGYDFMFSTKILSEAKAVTVSIKNVELKDALEQVFKSQPLTYKIDDQSVSIIKKGTPSFLDRVVDRFAAIDVRGVVVDGESGLALAGASVKVKGSGKATTTGSDGAFYLPGVNEKDVIVVSFIGYVSQELKATKDMGEIRLVMASADLQEVTINKGYYSTTRELNTGNVSTVTADVIGRQPIGDPMAALISRVPGLLVQQTSGVPGRAFKIRLRGQNSLDNGSDPLFIVDGVQYNSTPLNASSTNMFTAGGQASPFNYLNPADIESIEVLKDADATAIYGSRGANGVILINTKKAKDGKLELTARYYTSVSEAPLRVKFMNTQEYLAMRRLAFANDNKIPGAADYDLNGTWDTTRYTDWQKYFIGGAAPTNDASIGLTMGNSTTAIRIGAGYRSEGTIYPGDFHSKRGGLNFSATHSGIQNKFNVSFTGSYGYSQNNLPIGSAEQYLPLAPNAPDPYNKDGSLNWANSTWENPMAFYEQSATETGKTLVSNLSVSYNIWRKLTFKSSFGFTSTNFKQTNLYPWTLADPALAAVIQPSLLRQHSILNNEIQTFVIEPQLSYNQPLLNGDFDALLGGTFQRTATDILGMTANGFPSDAMIKNFAAGTIFSDVTRNSSEYKYSSVFARVGYAYKHRYVLNLTARRDASSRFGPGKKAGNFGAVGAGWIFTNEAFLGNLSNILSFGKLRLSYGTTGNDQLGEYKYLDTYSLSTLPYQGTTGLIPSQLTNPFYGWERVNKIELGLEIGFFDGDININAGLYRNRTKNQLVQVPLPETTGFRSVRANLPAIIQNSGFELEIRSTNIEKKHFVWSSAFNLTVPRNKLISFPGLESSSYARRVVIGSPINTLTFGYDYMGIDPNTGLYTFRDINKDGSFTTTQDQIPTFYGQKFYGGLYNSFRIGAIEIDFQFQFTKQNGYGLLSGPNGFFSAGRSNRPVNNKAIDEQPTTQSSTAVITQYGLFNSSNGSIIDASFLRLRNAGIYYTIPFLKKSIRQSKLYVQGQNIFTISKYFGSDPEAPSSGYAVPSLRTVAAGIQITL